MYCLPKLLKTEMHDTDWEGESLWLLKAMYYTVEVHNFDLQEKTTSTLK